MARVQRINVNPEGGVPKHRVPSARLLHGGVEGDKQRDLRHHGGPERAVCLYSAERLALLAQEGHPIGPGTTGENLTVEGLDWEGLQPGTVLAVGEARLQITRDATPCKNISASFAGGDISRISHKLHPGWSRMYARVLREGMVHEGDSVEAVTEE